VLAEKRAGALPPLSRLGRLLFVPERAVRERLPLIGEQIDSVIAGQELLGVVEARADVGFIRTRSASCARRGMDAHTGTWTFRRLSTALPAEQRSALCLRSLSLWTNLDSAD